MTTNPTDKSELLTTKPSEKSALLTNILANMRNTLPQTIGKTINLFELDKTFQTNPQELRKLLIVMYGPCQGELASDMFDRITSSLNT